MSAGFGFNLSALVALERSRLLKSDDVQTIVGRITDGGTKNLAKKILSERKKKKSTKDPAIELVRRLAGTRKASSL